jgi:ABC-type glutathione transport system ATPase component
MLTVEHLRKQFPIAGSRKVVSAINDVSFSIAPGETLGLVGESGSGKTTVGRIVVGLIEPTSGAVRFNLAGDAQGKARPPNGKVQLVFQEPAESLDPRMKIGSTIAEPLQALAVERTEWRRRVRDAMGLVRLNPALLDAYPAELSAGQQQRVGVARAMISSSASRSNATPPTSSFRTTSRRSASSATGSR